MGTKLAKSKNSKDAKSPTDNGSIPELTYFNGPGRANLTRLAFSAGGVQYKDTRYEFSEWPAIKTDKTSVPGQLFGSMPVIEHDGHLVGQSLACAVYAAELGIWREKDFLGKDLAEQSKNKATEMMVILTNEDLKVCMYKCLFGDDESKKAGREALPGSVAPLLAALERALERKTSPGPFFFSSAGPSLADLAVFDNVKSPFPGLQMLGIDISTDYPKLQALVDAVGEAPLVKAFVEEQAERMKQGQK